jgi:hypothetical protein
MMPSKDASRRTPRTSGRKTRPGVDPAEPVIPPTQERARHAEHGIEVAEPERTERGGGRAYTDAQGRASRPWRVVDTLAAMERAGTIDAGQRAAGERFRALFEISGRAGMAATRIEPRSAGGDPTSVIERRVAAGRALARAAEALGGPGPLHSIVVEVVGLGTSCAAWDRVHRCREGRAAGMLAQALRILADEWG